eukprot:jgi/Chlat1/8990/Chrsp94S08279
MSLALVSTLLPTLLVLVVLVSSSSPAASAERQAPSSTDLATVIKSGLTDGLGLLTLGQPSPRRRQSPHRPLLRRQGKSRTHNHHLPQSPHPHPHPHPHTLSQQHPQQGSYAAVARPVGLPSKAVSVSAWVRLARHRSFCRVLTAGAWVGNGWNLYTDAGGVARFAIGQNNKDFAASKILFRDKWHHLAGTYDGEYVRVYVDGVEGASVRYEGAKLDTNGPIYIGGGDYDRFIGLLDEVKIWDFALSPEQVRADMLTPPDPDTPGLVSYWPLDDASGPSALDASPRGNHASLGAGPEGASTRGRRRTRPIWTPSDAPIRVECAVSGRGTLLLHLAGLATANVLNNDADNNADNSAVTEDRVVAFVTTLAGQHGTLYDIDAAGLQAGVISSVPAELRDPRNRVAFEPNHSDRHLEAACASFTYRVRYTEEACEVRALAPSSCWAQRTRLEYAQRRVDTRPRVSVIIPVYNAGGDLPETVDSVLAQEFTSWEIVFVDDGSTDDSLDVINNIVAKHTGPQVMRVVTKANGGLADARNAGIQIAHAEWVFPLDADDLITPDFLSKAFAIIDRNTSVNVVIADLKGFGAWEYAWRLPEYDGSQLPYANAFHCSAVLRRDVWRAAGGYDPATLFGYEDWSFWLRAEATLVLAAHATFMAYGASAVPDKVVATVDDKLAKFPLLSSVHLMRGLITEGQRLSGSGDDCAGAEAMLTGLFRDYGEGLRRAYGELDALMGGEGGEGGLSGWRRCGGGGAHVS